MTLNNVKLYLLLPFLMLQFNSKAIDVDPKLDVDSLISVGRDSLSKPVVARKLFFKAYDIAKHGYFTKEEAISLNLIGQTYYNQKYYEQSINYFQKSLKVLFQMGEKRKIANMMKKIGLAYLNNNQKNKAAEYYNFAVKIYEQLNLDEKKANTLIELGVINSLALDYPKSVVNFQQALEIYKKHNRTFGIANAYNQLGVVYYYMGNYKKSQENYLLAKQIYEKEDSKSDLSIVLNNYGKVLIKIRQFKKAIDVIKSAEKNCSEKKSDLFANIKINLGVAYLNQNKFNEAQNELNLARTINDSVLSKETKSLLFRELYQVNLKQNKTKVALEYFKKYIAINDSIKNKKPLEYETIVTSGDNLTISITLVGLIVIVVLVVLLIRVVKQRDAALEELKKIKNS